MEPQNGASNIAPRYHYFHVPVTHYSLLSGTPSIACLVYRLYGGPCTCRLEDKHHAARDGQRPRGARFVACGPVLQTPAWCGGAEATARCNPLPPFPSLFLHSLSPSPLLFLHSLPSSLPPFSALAAPLLAFLLHSCIVFAPTVPYPPY